jgi:AraC-like DNA-binding protein
LTAEVKWIIFFGMKFELLDIISIFTSIQLTLFAVFLFTYPKGVQIRNKILSLFLISNALFIADFILSRFMVHLYFDYAYLFYIGMPFGLLFGPMLYFYTKSLSYSNFIFNKSDFIHFIPFIVLIAYFIISFHIHSIDVKRELLISRKFPVLIHNLIISYTFHLQVLFYMVLSLLVLKEYRIKIKNIYSEINLINLSWLLIILISFIFMWLIDLSNFILAVFKIRSIWLNNLLNLISLSINFIFANVIIFKGLRRPEVFSGIEEKIKYESSSLTSQEKKQYLNLLNNYMHSKKPYLNPTLNINELAEQLSIPSRYLSQVINENLNHNFFDFINYHRIKEAQKILMEPDKQKTVLAVLYEVGFNSKSSFNTAFKKFTGMTPTEFKKSTNNYLL